MILKFLEFLCIPDCLIRMLYFKFQAVFEKKTEECASNSVINETKGPSWNIWWQRAAVENVWKMVKSHGKVIEKSGNFEIENEWQPCQTMLKGTSYLHWCKLSHSEKRDLL